ncbi:MAG: DUF3333 domain-containing protein, partial [Pseudomonadota bacterium]
MTDAAPSSTDARTGRNAVTRHVRRRHRAERRFKIYGVVAILFALAMLVILIGSIAV